MPEEKIKLDRTLNRLDILDKDGNLDDKLAPELDDKTLVSMYYQMKLARKADEKMLKLQRQGRLGTFALASGHEAISLGAAFAINNEDWYVPAYRELGGMLYRGWPFEDILLYWNGYEEGNIPPDDSNTMPMCVPVSSQCVYATGIGMSLNLQEIEDQVVVAFFGDGASSEGDTHEAMNFASVFNAPVIFVCLNNQFAISVPIEKQMNCDTVAQRALGYGIPGIQVDGDDILAVYKATAEAAERARKGKGPSLIEAVTYRTLPHTTADDPDKYLPEEKVEEWKKRDPIIRLEKLLRDKKLLTDEKEEEFEEKIKNQIKEAVKNAEKKAKEIDKKPERMFDYLYEKSPGYLEEQRSDFLSERESKLTQETEAKNQNGKESSEKGTDASKRAKKGRDDSGSKEKKAKENFDEKMKEDDDDDDSEKERLQEAAEVKPEDEDSSEDDQSDEAEENGSDSREKTEKKKKAHAKG